ncbi:transcriptional regulator, GntR family with aminotransferase domain containing protein [Actinobacteria bacterium OK074]|nr:transcriptional regulator, GntR family with aminotransferase domain containing protein [Actinobacteria bacterium OK074]
MANHWATSGVDLRLAAGVDLHLEPGGGGLRRGLTDALRDAVRSGRLAPGTRLPSSRTLAVDLGIARNTVAEAYADLVAEGWLTARQGSGTRVVERGAVERGDLERPSRERELPSRSSPSRPSSPQSSSPQPSSPQASSPRPSSALWPSVEGMAARRRRAEGGRPVHDLRPGTPDLGAFPRAEWLRAARRALTAAPHEAFGYGDPRGRTELRTALADYLSRARGVRANPERVLVTAGFAHALRLLGTVLRARGVRTVAVEAYGVDVYWELLEAAGLRTVPLRIDELGPRTEELGATGAVLLTPAHQMPLGMALHPERRAAALDWARRTGGLVLEDDYDGEFRYDRQPVGALQGLDPDRVVYLGTASKALAPGLRLGWAVLPPSLVPEVAVVKGEADNRGVLDQLTLAEFIASGAYDRHVRAARLRYRRRRDTLVEALARHAPAVHVTGIAAGLHAVLQLPPGTRQWLLRAAAWQGLAVEDLDRFRHPRSTAGPTDALVVGYGTPPEHGWAGALEALCAALPDASS